MNQKKINIHAKQSQTNQEIYYNFLVIKRLKPNRKREYGRRVHNIMPSELIAKHPEAMVDSLSRLERQFFVLMLSLRSRYNVVKPSHAWIAEQLDCSLTHVQNLIDRFENLGLISPSYRHMRSSIFTYSHWLRIPDVVRRLQSFFPGIRAFALAFLHTSLLLSPAGNYVRDVKLCQCIKDQDKILFINKRELEMAYDTYGDPPKHDSGNKEISHPTKNLKGEAHNPSNKSYGGTGLYDRKTSQIELDLLKTVRERQRRKYSMDYTADEEAQPRYNEPKMPAERRHAYPEGSMYTPYIPKERKKEDPLEASAKLIEWTQSEQFKKVSALLGEEVALKMCNKIVSNALEEYQE